MTHELLKALEPHLLHHQPPGGDEFTSVSEKHLRDFARRQGIGLRRVMAACLRAGVWPERLRPNRGVFSAQDQARILDSSAAVIGAGGLGGMVVLQMVRFGVGRLTVCDGDVFDESNLNRQFLCRLDRLGRNKARCAAEEAAALNPAVRVRAVEGWASAENLPDILSGADIALDCLDNLATRYVLENACRRLDMPYIHGSVAGLEGLVMTVMPGDPGLVGLYGPEPPPKDESAEVLLGVPTMTPAAAAVLQVNEAVRLLLGRVRPEQRRRVLHLDLAGPSIETMNLG
jgi:molybdopterin/thiamine biosynthesis adenylyltransferase